MFLQWTPLAINYLVLVTLISVITGYLALRVLRLARTQMPRREVALLLVTYAGGLGAMFAQFLGYALSPDYANFAWPWVTVFAAVAMAGFVRFAYEFQRPTWRGGWQSPVLNLVYLTIFAIELWVAIQRTLYAQDGYVEFREAWLDIPFNAGFALAYVFFADRYLSAIAAHHGFGRLRCIGPALQGLFRRADALPAQAAAARAFILVSLLPLGHVLLLLLRGYGVLDWAIVEGAGTALALLLFCGFALAHLNYAPEASTFQVKLVGSALMVVLVIVASLAWMIAPVYIAAYQSTHRLPPETTLRFAPGPDGGYRVARTAHYYDLALGGPYRSDDPVQMPFHFPFFGLGQDWLFIHPEGMLGFDELPFWRDVQHQFGPQPAIFAQPVASRPATTEEAGVFVNLAPDRVTVTFHNMAPLYGSVGLYRTQVRLYPTGVIEIALDAAPRDVPETLWRAHGAPMMLGIVPGWEDRKIQQIRFAKDLPVQALPKVGLVERYRSDFRTHLDQVFRPMAIFVLSVSLCILLFFPRFYSVNLNRPLQRMMMGVEGIMRGKLDTSIPIAHQDEFGYLASAFNRMARTQQDLITTLEDKVAERSEVAANLAAKNARLEERHHLARELHDAVSQTLFAANLEADALPALTETDPRAAVLSAKRLQSLNQDALAEMRLLLAELRPERLLNCPFGTLLRALAEDMRAKHTITVDLSIAHDICLPDPVQLAFFRVAQEALNNIVKHAGTTQVQILFDGLENQGLISVQDKGVGFDMQSLTHMRYGLRSMSERLENIGGEFEITTEPGKGTTITAIWYRLDD